MEIKIPTSFITGEFDETCPSTVKYYQTLLRVLSLHIEDSSLYTIFKFPIFELFNFLTDNPTVITIITFIYAKSPGTF